MKNEGEKKRFNFQSVNPMGLLKKVRVRLFV